MKKIFCPKCDEELTLSEARLKELRTSDGQYLAIVCTGCAHQLRLRLKPQAETKSEATAECGHIVVLENTFGYKQYFALRRGDNHIGRRNKDTHTDIPIITGDPSMDRHHAIIRVSQTKQGRTMWTLSDNDSRVGTFVGSELLGAKEWYRLSDGDVFTLGATTIIFSTNPIPTEDETIEGERL